MVCISVMYYCGFCLKDKRFVQYPHNSYTCIGGVGCLFSTPISFPLRFSTFVMSLCTIWTFAFKIGLMTILFLINILKLLTGNFLMCFFRLEFSFLRRRLHILRYSCISGQNSMSIFTLDILGLDMYKFLRKCLFLDILSSDFFFQTLHAFLTMVNSLDC